MRMIQAAFFTLILVLSSMAIMPQYSDFHLAQTSDIIVIARVAREGRAELIQGHNICTPWHIEVEQYLKGNGAGELVFHTQGGQLPNSSTLLWVEDQAEPREGERALIFLWEGNGNWFVNGLFQGYRTISHGLISDYSLEEYANYIMHLAHGEEIPLPRLRPMAETSTMAITGFTPSSGVAGDGTVTVTITGSGFGHSLGTVEFTFYQWPSSTPTYLPPSWTTIHYWSDTEIRTDVPARASSGPIRVTPNLGSPMVSPTNFYVTFGYQGNRWEAATPVWVTLDYNETTFPVAGCHAAMQRALNTWSTAGAWWRYQWGDTTSRGDADFDARDDHNVIHFGYFSDPSPPLGVCQIYLSGWGIMYIVEMDIRLNAAHSWSTSTPATDNDVESITLHEAGHGLQLMDVYGIADIGKVMFGVSTTGTYLRTLHADDNAGIIYIYGSDATEIEEPAEIFTTAEMSLSPRPARDFGHIELNLANAGNVRVEIVDITGRTVSVPFDGRLESGRTAVPFDISGAHPAGVYFAVARVGGQTLSEKLVLVK